MWLGHAPAGDNDDNEDKGEEKPSDGSSNHYQEGKTVCKWKRLANVSMFEEREEKYRSV